MSSLSGSGLNLYHLLLCPQEDKTPSLGASKVSNSQSDSLYKFDSVIYYSNIMIEENLAFVCYSKCFASHSSILPHFI